MACPDFQSLTLPILQIAASGKELTLAVLRAEVARKLSLSESDLAEKIPSGKQTRYYNRTNWACIYMSEAGLLEKQVKRVGGSRSVEWRH
jgi:restriction system protein